jgi:hypothetical protein
MVRGVACPRAVGAAGVVVILALGVGCGGAERYTGAARGIAGSGVAGSGFAGGGGAAGDVPVLPIGTGGTDEGGSAGLTGAAGAAPFIDAGAPDGLADAVAEAPGSGGATGQPRPDAGGGAGATGVAGKTGAAGATGSAGATGMAGAMGSAGAAGATGGAGATGSAGATGGAGAAGGAGATGGGGITGACAGKVHALGAADTLIADFEAAGLTGWYEYRDATAGGTLSPLALVTPGASGSAHGGHLAGTGLPAFGAGLGLGLACWDASRFVGVTFWAKGTAGPSNSLALQVALPATHAVANGGDCVARCFDHPSKSVVLGAEWQSYSIKFIDLQQAGFGDPATYKGLIMALNWVSLAGPNVDVYVDQIAFY